MFVSLIDVSDFISKGHRGFTGFCDSAESDACQYTGSSMLYTWGWTLLLQIRKFCKFLYWCSNGLIDWDILHWCHCISMRTFVRESGSSTKDCRIVCTHWFEHTTENCFQQSHYTPRWKCFGAELICPQARYGVISPKQVCGLRYFLTLLLVFLMCVSYKQNIRGETRSFVSIRFQASDICLSAQASKIKASTHSLCNVWRWPYMYESCPLGWKYTCGLTPARPSWHMWYCKQHRLWNHSSLFVKPQGALGICGLRDSNAARWWKCWRRLICRCVSSWEPGCSGVYPRIGCTQVPWFQLCAVSQLLTSCFS